MGPTTQVADLKNRLRDYDPASDTLSFQGQRISLRELSDALDDLARKLEAAQKRAAAPDPQPVLGLPGNARLARI